ASRRRKSRPSTPRMSVDLPLPLGPETMITAPGVIAPPLLDVLHQLANLLQRPLDLDDVPRDVDVAGLRADGVGLAEHLLGEELQLAAGALRLVDDVLELAEVAGQPDDLLTDVRAFGKDGDFLDKVLTVDLDVQFAQQGADALEHAVAVALADLGDAVADHRQ